MKFQFNDGGRNAAGFKGKAGDCFTRSVAIATGLPYQQVYDLVNEYGARERTGTRKRGKSDARKGVYTQTARKIMQALGWQWVPTMQIGSGCKVHLHERELPAGRLLVCVSRHYTAVIDGVINDAHDPQREGTRCVYGYFHKPASARAAVKPFRVSCSWIEYAHGPGAESGQALALQLCERVDKSAPSVPFILIPADRADLVREVIDVAGLYTGTYGEDAEGRTRAMLAANVIRRGREWLKAVQS